MKRILKYLAGLLLLAVFLAFGWYFLRPADTTRDPEYTGPELWRFKRVVLDAGLDEPVAMAFHDANRLYYIQRKGEVQRFDFASNTTTT